ncbi:hypothetical protein C7440_2081 [Pusillimonas noertemannii]|uniref:Uncharacterized protein n=1 Tax=Pusillimonas noertemannii TaxID=305977 RepID=A0A2U1CNQ9_9BURK|nr:hypothetical protein C7440_2081 [Pusillimonas noertemannii]
MACNPPFQLAYALSATTPHEAMQPAAAGI